MFVVGKKKTYFVHYWYEFRERIVVSIGQRMDSLVELNDVFPKHFVGMEFLVQMDWH